MDGTVNRRVGNQPTSVSATAGELAMLAAACLYPPLTVWANNLAEVGFPSGLLLWAGIVWIVAVGVRWLLTSMGANSRGVTMGLFWALLAFGTLNRAGTTSPAGGWMLAAAVAVGAVIVYLLRAMPLIGVATSWMVVFAAIAPFGLAAVSFLGRGVSEVAPVSTTGPIAITDTRDVVLIVFDAQGSPRVLADDYGMDEDWVGVLNERGLQEVSGIWANYSMTHVSLASFFRMDYPVSDGARIGEAEWADLLQTIEGDNPFVATFRRAGYNVVFVESPWSSIRCSRFVDECVRGVWPDYATTTAISQSLLGAFDLPGITENAARGNRRSIAWLSNELGRKLDDDVPDLVIAHLLLPHPPLRLDSTCGYRADGGQGDTVVSWAGMSESDIEARRRLYVDQVRCAVNVLSTVADVVGDRGVLLAFGDHGPDSRLQLMTPPSAWSDAALVERFETFFATNLGDCPFDRAASLVNVGRVLVACLGAEPLPLLDDRYFIVLKASPVSELPARRVKMLSNVP